MVKKTTTKSQCVFLPSRQGGDEEGGLEDLAGGNGMCGRGLREVGTRWRGWAIMGGEKHVKLHTEDKADYDEKLYGLE